MTVEERNSAKLKAVIKDEITRMFEKTLDFAQVACPEPNFKPLRSKILRVGNDCIRTLQKEIDSNWDVKFKAKLEDIIEVKGK